MALDHEAIYEAYKSEAKPVVTIDDSRGAFDALVDPSPPPPTYRLLLGIDPGVVPPISE